MDEVDESLVAIADRVTRRLRAGHRIGRTVVLRLRFDDSTRATLSHTLPHPTAHTSTILATARALLVRAMPRIRRDGITLVGLAVANLSDDDVLQPPLAFQRSDGTDLDATVDDIRERFGSKSVTRGRLLDRSDDLEVPLLPDPVDGPESGPA
jgi:DNA polymerase-4